MNTGLARFDSLLLVYMWLLTPVVFRLARLPYAFDMAALSKAYWLMPEGAVFVAILFATFGLPPRLTVLPFFPSPAGATKLLLVLAPLALLL